MVFISNKPTAMISVEKGHNHHPGPQLIVFVKPQVFRHLGLVSGFVIVQRVVFVTGSWK